MDLTSNPSAKLKFLVLHGFRDNGARRLKQMQTLTRKLRGVEFVALDAPLLVSPYEDATLSPEELEHQNLCKWWSLSKEDIFSNPTFDTLQQSIAHVYQHLQSSPDGPFDGILGFSQGAVLTACLLASVEWENLSVRYRPRFAILVGGFAVSDDSVKQALELCKMADSSFPILHVAGTNDTLVPLSQSMELIKQLHRQKLGTESEYENATLLQHPGGHYVPSNADARQAVQRWIDQRRI